MSGPGLPLSELRELFQAARRANNVDSVGGMADVGATGTQFTVSPNRWVLVEVGTGRGTGTLGGLPAFFYDWSPLNSIPLYDLSGIAGTETYDDFFDLIEGGDTITHDVFPLVEINGQTGIAGGTQVFAWVSEADDCLLFEYKPSSGGGGSTVEVKGGTTAISAFTADTLDFDPTYTTSTESPSGEANVALVVASGSTGGVLTASTQTIAGDKTFTGDITFSNTSTTAQGNLYANSNFYITHTSGSYIRTYYSTTYVQQDLWDSSPSLKAQVQYGFNPISYDVTHFIVSTTSVAAYGVSDTSGTYQGGSAVTGGLTFRGGLYISGTATGGYTDEEAQDAVGAILTDSSTIDFTYSDGTPSITADVKDSSITDAKLRDSAGLSVVGRASNVGGVVADITASSDTHVLFRNGTTLGFGRPKPTSLTAVGAKCTRTTTFGPNNSATGYNIPFTSEDYDTDSIHDNSTNNTRMTVPSGMDGLWIVSGTAFATFTVGPDADAGCYIVKNGIIIASLNVRAGTINTLTVVDKAVAGDYFELQIWHYAGSAKTWNWTAVGQTSFSATYLGAG